MQSVTDVIGDVWVHSLAQLRGMMTSSKSPMSFTSSSRNGWIMVSGHFKRPASSRMLEDVVSGVFGSAPELTVVVAAAGGSFLDSSAPP